MPLIAPSKIKILFLGANPSDTTRVALGREVREITQRLRASSQGERFEFVQEWAVRVSDLQAALLRHRPQIVHFSGHGRGERISSAPNSDVTREMLPAHEPDDDEDHMAGEVLVEDDAGRAEPIPAAALADLFGILGGVRCVVLNACHSAVQAEAIRQHVDAVVGMSQSIQDAAAINFAWAFYQALAFGESVSKAFELGRNQIDLARLGDGKVPKLLTRQPGSDPRFPDASVAPNSAMQRRAFASARISGSFDGWTFILTGVRGGFSLSGYTELTGQKSLNEALNRVTNSDEIVDESFVDFRHRLLCKSPMVAPIVFLNLSLPGPDMPLEIQLMRRHFPKSVFVLYGSGAELQRCMKEAPAPWGEQFQHYYLLRKSEDGVSDTELRHVLDEAKQLAIRRVHVL